MTLGQQIKKIRMEKELSQPVLADTMGIEQSYLSKLENDKSVPSNDMYRKLLKGLESTTDDLLGQLDHQYIHSNLHQVPDIEQWLIQKRSSLHHSSRRWLLTSSALIAIAITFFYSGYNKAIFSEIQYEYISSGIVMTGEPFDYFEHGAYASTQPDEHDRVRAELRERYDPDEVKAFTLKGTSFNLDVGGGTRRYLLKKESTVTRTENSILRILGVFLFTCGLMGFALERRIHQLNKMQGN